MHYIVYKTTNQVNGKFYIGTHKTVDLNDDYLGSGKLLRYAVEKYGIQNFKREILFVFDNPEEMFAKEAEIVTEEFLSENNTYNLKKGGEGGFDLINKTGKNLYYDKDGNCLNGIVNAKNLLRENTLKNLLIERGEWDSYREKISKNKKEYFQKHPANFLGKKHSDETRKKISQSSSVHQKGSKNSQFGTMWITNEISSKKIKASDPIPDGWRKGRSW